MQLKGGTSGYRTKILVAVPRVSPYTTREAAGLVVVLCPSYHWKSDCFISQSKYHHDLVICIVTFYFTDSDIWDICHWNFSKNYFVISKIDFVISNKRRICDITKTIFIYHKWRFDNKTAPHINEAMILYSRVYRILTRNNLSLLKPVLSISGKSQQHIRSRGSKSRWCHPPYRENWRHRFHPRTGTRGNDKEREWHWSNSKQVGILQVQTRPSRGILGNRFTSKTLVRKQWPKIQGSG